MPLPIGHYKNTNHLTTLKTHHTGHPTLATNYHPTHKIFGHIYTLFLVSFTVLETICSNIWSGTPEDGHNGARNMLS